MNEGSMTVREAQSTGPTSSLPRVLRDAKLEKELERRGYVIVRLLEQAQIERLNREYERFGRASDQPFYTSLWTDRFDYRQAVFEALCSVIQPRLDELLIDYQICLGDFAVRHAHSDESAVPLHQDWTFVDEQCFQSMTLWMPLIDVNSDNGCLTVVPGSHLFPRYLRPNSKPADFRWPYGEVEQEIRQRYLKENLLSAGEAILYYSNVLHASRGNRSDQDRVAVAATAVPRNADLWHCFRASPTTIDVYGVDRDFYWREVRLGEAPKNPLFKRTMHDRMKPVTSLEARDVLGAV